MARVPRNLARAKSQLPGLYGFLPIPLRLGMSGNVVTAHQSTLVAGLVNQIFSSV